MEQFTARWSQSTDWSAPMPAWDKPGRLVVVFGPADLLDGDAPLPAIAADFGLSIRAGRDGERELVRTVLGVDEGRQSMTFAGDVLEGSTPQLTRRDRRALRRVRAGRRRRLTAARPQGA